MDQLNLRHLYYFWVISREGSIAKASELLDLAPQTLSGQLATFEESVGGQLFSRERRRLVLTELGQLVQSYANDIFALTGELSETLRQAPADRPLRLAAGVSASIHKLIAFQLLQPALKLNRRVNLDCRTGRAEDLLLSLKRKELDVVLTDRMPQTEAVTDRFAVHPLTSSTISLFAAPEMAGRLRDDFPASLNHQPLLANATDAPYFQKLMNWLTISNVRMDLVARVDDSALIKVFGREGLGVFAAPTAIKEEVCRQYQVEEIAPVKAVTDQLYAITRSRKVAHEGVRAICSGFDLPR
ncbi:MAG: LysR family transcriptional regulator [Marinobacter sp.]|uniref:LysR family transcriptional regulator n=1 Tax=Marinobacter sp. TaxID=50741 RepID=UPI0029C189D2|nr:LysR family transcriptional regulator [Marinobacter sp.]MDX5439489.1 LysR family transcriptional regulator [Alteromonadaceae bacterium]MDX5327335.1 LysR family transcriptional regulator [Marinobacter sp.]MDX5335822.1 LysR family transcriptional regulator [Marinobacter sp.]MDX5386831.1 LysR family transcriptional regulator [Marinobacter sp.]MDX5472232.1 LysR family transcriptional regulator [Marinobacter sp.]